MKSFFDQEIFKVKLNADFEDDINLNDNKLQKNQGKPANLTFDLEKVWRILLNNEIKINDQNNKIVLNGLKLKDEKIIRSRQNARFDKDKWKKIMIWVFFLIKKSFSKYGKKIRWSNLE